MGFAIDGDSFLVWFARLRVTHRGSIAVAWTTQHVVDVAWHDDSTTGWLLTPFWLPKRSMFKQNHMVTGQ